MTGEDFRRFSPSVGRNRKVVAEAFLDNVCDTASVLEIGSGSGEHGVYITEQSPEKKWTFTDYNTDAFLGISAWIAHAGRRHLYGPYQVDAAASDGGGSIEKQDFDVIFSANVIHISPFSVTEGLFAGAKRRLGEGGKLFLYGPFSRNGVMVASNQEFDASLKARNPEWGVRDLERDLLPLAEQVELRLALTAGMPANNLVLVFEKA